MGDERGDADLGEFAQLLGAAIFVRVGSRRRRRRATVESSSASQLSSDAAGRLQCAEVPRRRGPEPISEQATN